MHEAWSTREGEQPAVHVSYSATMLRRMVLPKAYTFGLCSPGCRTTQHYYLLAFKFSEQRPNSESGKFVASFSKRASGNWQGENVCLGQRQELRHQSAPSRLNLLGQLKRGYSKDAQHLPHVPSPKAKKCFAVSPFFSPKHSAKPAPSFFAIPESRALVTPFSDKHSMTESIHFSEMMVDTRPDDSGEDADMMHPLALSQQDDVVSTITDASDDSPRLVSGVWPQPAPLGRFMSKFPTSAGRPKMRPRTSPRLRDSFPLPVIPEDDAMPDDIDMPDDDVFASA